MTSAVWGRTPNIKLGLLEFNFPNWADDSNLNMKLIDAALGIAGVTVEGAWLNSTTYIAGMLVIDGDSSTLWRCSVGHISADIPTTFAQDRAAHPTYWVNADNIITPRGMWTTATAYYKNDIVYKDANKYSWAIASQQFVSGASYDADVATGNFVIITDLTLAVADANAAKTAAQGSATAAAGSASSASGSASAASTSASNAATSAGQANTYASAASGYATQALTYSNNASTFATNASNSATASSTSATNASNSASAAATSAANALALYNAMLPDAASDGKTYGRKNATWSEVASTTYPDAPNDGLTYGRKNNAWAIVLGGAAISDTAPSSPLHGQLWWDSSTGDFYIYYNDGTSSQWVQVNLSGV